jgi:hypothetical protein
MSKRTREEKSSEEIRTVIMARLPNPELLKKLLAKKDAKMEIIDNEKKIKNIKERRERLQIDVLEKQEITQETAEKALAPCGNEDIEHQVLVTLSEDIESEEKITAEFEEINHGHEAKIRKFERIIELNKQKIMSLSGAGEEKEN